MVLDLRYALSFEQCGLPEGLAPTCIVYDHIQGRVCAPSSTWSLFSGGTPCKLITRRVGWGIDVN